MVAVTEIGNALEAGSAITAKELQDAGLVMEKSWLTVGDDRVCSEECELNEAQGWIPLDEPFASGHMHPLAHPACRCTALQRRVAGVARGAEQTEQQGESAAMAYLRGRGVGVSYGDVPGLASDEQARGDPTPQDTEKAIEAYGKALRMVNEYGVKHDVYAFNIVDDSSVEWSGLVTREQPLIRYNVSGMRELLSLADDGNEFYREHGERAYQGTDEIGMMIHEIAHTLYASKPGINMAAIWRPAFDATPTGKYPSWYAETNIQECFAETVTGLILGNPIDTGLAAAARRILELWK